MLRNIGIRSKILAVLALPVLVLLLAATVISVGAVRDARRAAQVESLAGQAPELTQLVRGLQAERALSMQAVSGVPVPQLAEVRLRVSGSLASVRDGIADVDVELLDQSAVEAIAASEQAHGQLESLRDQVDGGGLTPEAVQQFYTEVIAEDVELAGRIGLAVDDRVLTRNLTAFSAVERLVEVVATERDLAHPAVVDGVVPADLKQRLAQLEIRQEVLREEAQAAADAVGVHVPATNYALELARQQTSGDQPLSDLSGNAWRDAVQQEIDALSAAESRLAAAAVQRASALADAARARALQVGLGTAALVVVPVLLALFIARAITRPLRRLTEAAADVRRELPTMVEQMHTPGEGPELSLPAIPVTSNDELGRLASAFNDVNAMTVQVAQEQAALRGSIAAMFVNVARRDQVLLSRQLAFIDQLERTEENPKTLENLFRLDHLATRMRRNAESLLVLAGIDTGRRLRRPMPLSDVVRTATSEIEHYERVDLVLQTDPPMVGHVALTTAHLLAELLENATNFSDPDTRVVVSTAPGPKGVVVTVTDDGLGMTRDEIAEANSRIAEPPVAEVVGAQRLGFFVVGRLARRLDATVTLAAGTERGTVVRLDLPAALFVPGAVVELPAADTTDETDELPVVPERPTVALVDEPAAPSPPPAPRTDAGLPVRGGAPVRVSPPSSVQRPPAPAPEPAAAPAPVADVPVADVPAPVTKQAPEVGADGLPRRARSVDVVPGDPAPATASTEAGPARRPGLFSSFRARRPGESDTPVSDVPAADEPSAAPAPARPTVPARPAAPANATPAPAPTRPLPTPPGPAPASPVPATSTPAPVATPAPVPAPAPVRPAEPAPAPEPLVAAAALDILPSRSSMRRSGKQPRSRGLFGRRAKPADPVSPVRPMTRRELRDLDAAAPAPFTPRTAPAPSTPAPPVTAAPAPSAPSTGAPVPAAPRPVSQPPAPAPAPAASTPVGQVPPAGPAAAERPVIAAPSSLFGTPAQPAPGPAPGPGPGQAPGAAPAPGAPTASPSTILPSRGGAAPGPSFAAPSGPSPVAPAPRVTDPASSPVPASQAGRAAASPAADEAPAPVPVAAVPGADGMAEVLRQRSALASEALTELSRLSAYSPAAVDAKPPATLTRRTPASTPAAQVAEPRPASAQRRTRNAADVRSMLSGFQAGVARGRTSPTDPDTTTAPPTGGHA
ncbi:MAG: nitrate- and nitrite sensing domain-containing protein [Actinomycetes bacterium]